MRDKAEPQTRTCKRRGCGETFTPYRPTQEHCSPKCRRLHWNDRNPTLDPDESDEVLREKLRAFMESRHPGRRGRLRLRFGKRTDEPMLPGSM